MSFFASINDLPPQIILDILSRLPTKTIIHCRFVCKTWLCLLLEPYFAKLHLTRSPTALIVHQLDPRPHFPIGDSGVLKLVELDHAYGRRGDLHCGPDPVIRFDIRSACHPEAGQILLVGSINGLICFWDFKNEVVHITNPITREYVTLPKPNYSRNPSCESVLTGFGFCSVSGCYKVVQIFQRPVYPGRPRRYETRVEVYTLGTGRWRSVDIGSSTLDFLYDSRTSPFLNGKIHWLVSSADVVERPDTISCFDVEKETFHTISTPRSNGSVYKWLVLSEGCLSVRHSSVDSGPFIWVMKEYGVNESWTKQTVPEKQYPAGVPTDVFSPVKVSGKRGDLNFLWHEDYLYGYNPERKNLEEVEIPRFHFPPGTKYGVLFYVTSFRSLKNLVTTTEKVGKI